MLAPVFDAQRALGEFERHGEEADHRHPERGARPAHGNRDRDTGDVAESHGPGQGGRQRLELGDLARCRAVVIAAAHDVPGNPEAPQIDEAEIEGEQQHGCRHPQHDQLDRLTEDGHLREDRFTQRLGEPVDPRKKGVLQPLQHVRHLPPFLPVFPHGPRARVRPQHRKDEAGVATARELA
ncbi:MAG: hypothetical protein KatS3mg082_2411 [Nitrospiraceae bacterium]|nr:MAG: hypothetical protein KatS3mg082_2411 [Nitrospiraceae bacterium]